MVAFIIGFDKEFIVDVYVYAREESGQTVGSYEIVCNGSKADSNVLRSHKEGQELSCMYMATMQKAFLRALDYSGKYAIPTLDPDGDILVKKGEKIKGVKKKLSAKFVFRFRIPDDRVLQIIEGGPIPMTVNEEKWRNLLKLMRMKMAKPTLPYRNLYIEVKYEFKKCSTAEISEIVEFAEREMRFIHTNQKKDGER